jgi:hypothetical protein
LHVHGFCRRDAGLDASAAPDWKVHRRKHGKDSVGLSRVRARHKIPTVQRQGRNVLRLRCVTRLRGSAELRFRRLDVGTTRERRAQRVLERYGRSRCVLHRRCERDLLSERQANDPTQCQFLSRQIALQRDQPKLLLLQLDLAAIDVNARVHARFVLARRLCVDGTCGVDLRRRRIHTSRGGDYLQVPSAYRKDDQVAVVAQRVSSSLP